MFDGCLVLVRFVCVLPLKWVQTKILCVSLWANLVFFGAVTLPGYHYLARNAYRSYPSPYRPTPPELQQVMVELGRIFYANQPGTFSTDHPLVIQNSSWAAAPEQQEAWLRSHPGLHPELTAFYLGLTRGRPDHFVLVLVPGSWKCFVLSVLDDCWKRSRRAWRRLVSG